jgi:hypothetical protein
MSVGKDDCEQRRVMFTQPGNLRNERRVRFDRIERQAEIDNNAASRCLDLNAGAADLLRAAMDADPHVISALRASGEPVRELSYDNEHRSARVIDSGVFSRQHDVRDKCSAIELWVEDQKPSVVLLAPVHATARKIVVVIVSEGFVKALHHGPNVNMSFVEGFEARNFGNAAERPRDRGEAGRIAILRDEPNSPTRGSLEEKTGWISTLVYSVEARLNLLNGVHILVVKPSAG